MGDYISRDAVLKFVADIQECKYEPDKIFLYCQHLKRIPAADVVPVVRCKDCSKRKTIRCPMFECSDEVSDADWTQDDGYCNCGARMDKEATT